MLHVDPHLKDMVRKQIEERSKRTGPAKRPITTVKGTALFDLQFRAEVEGHSFIADERASAGGHDAGPAPMRYFIAGIMLCHKVWVVKSAALKDIAFDKLEGEISLYGDDPIPRLAYKVIIDSPHTDKEIAGIVEDGAQGCLAFKTMERAARIDLTVVHNGKTIVEETRGAA
jgi:uncharacterized OsmC-like protein